MAVEKIKGSTESAQANDWLKSISEGNKTSVKPSGFYLVVSTLSLLNTIALNNRLDGIRQGTEVSQTMGESQINAAHEQEKKVQDMLEQQKKSHRGSWLQKLNPRHMISNLVWAFTGGKVHLDDIISKAIVSKLEKLGPVAREIVKPFMILALFAAPLPVNLSAILSAGETGKTKEILGLVGSITSTVLQIAAAIISSVLISVLTGGSMTGVVVAKNLYNTVEAVKSIAMACQSISSGLYQLDAAKSLNALADIQSRVQGLSSYTDINNSSAKQSDQLAKSVCEGVERMIQGLQQLLAPLMVAAQSTRKK